MTIFLKSLALSAGLLMSAHGYAQTYTTTPPAKPAASATAPATTKGTMVANPLEQGSSGSAPPPAKGATKSTPVPASAAPGGGEGKVWVNSKSKVYHCPGTKFYGKTKAGEYMSEADAKAKGNHPNNKKACS